MKRKIFFVFGLVILTLAFNAKLTFAQCGADGTQPCETPKTKPVAATPAIVKPVSKAKPKTKKIQASKPKKSSAEILESLKVPTGKAERDDQSIFRSLQLDPEKVSNENSAGDFFPLDGVTLGKTTERQLVILNGEKKVYVDQNTKEEKIYYTIKGNDFWLRNGVADSVSAFSFNEMPQKWRQLGFNWKLSFNQNVALLKQLGYQIIAAETPPTGWNGAASFSGRIKAVKKENIPLTVALTFVFTKQKPGADSSGTLFYFLTMLTPQN